MYKVTFIIIQIAVTVYVRMYIHDSESQGQKEAGHMYMNSELFAAR